MRMLCIIRGYVAAVWLSRELDPLRCFWSFHVDLDTSGDGYGIVQNLTHAKSNFLWVLWVEPDLLLYIRINWITETTFYISKSV